MAKKKPLLRRVRARLLGKARGRTIGTQEKQIRELGLLDENGFKKIKPMRKRRRTR